MGRILNINYIDYSPATKSLDLFVAGCNQPYCKDCCNPELLDFKNPIICFAFLTYCLCIMIYPNNRQIVTVMPMVFGTVSFNA